MFVKGNTNGHAGAKKGNHEKTLLRAELAVRLEMLNLGYTDIMIALHIGMKVGAYRMLKKTDAYKRIYSQYLSGVIAPMDEAVRDNYKIGRKMLSDSVPLALQNLAMAAAQKIDKKLQMDATKEILDREGSFAKVSRVGIPTKDQGGFADSKDNETAAELLKSLNTVVRQEQEKAPPTIESPSVSTSVQ